MDFKSTSISNVPTNLNFWAEKLAISILEVNRRFVIISKMSVGANEVL